MKPAASLGVIGGSYERHELVEAAGDELASSADSRLISCALSASESQFALSASTDSNTSPAPSRAQSREGPLQGPREGPLQCPRAKGSVYIYTYIYVSFAHNHILHDNLMPSHRSPDKLRSTSMMPQAMSVSLLRRLLHLSVWKQA